MNKIKYICALFYLFSRVNLCASRCEYKKAEYKYNSNWEFAKFPEIYSDSVFIYRTNVSQRKNKVIYINAGHGTSNGTKRFVYCHPNETPQLINGNIPSRKKKTYAVTD